MLVERPAAMKRVVGLFINHHTRNVAILGFGNVIGLVVMFVTQPIITRIYTPVQIAITALVASIVAMCGDVINGKYDLAIVMAKDDQEADRLAVGSLYVCGGGVVMLGIVLIVLLLTSPATLGAGYWTLLAVPFLFIRGLTQILASYNNRKKQYKLIASVTVIRQIANSVVQIGLGLLQCGVVGIFVAQIISSILGLRQQARCALQNWRCLLAVTLRDVRCVLREHVRQPLFNAPAVFLASFSFSILSYLILHLYDLEQVGYFAMSMSLLAIPTSVISSNMQKVYFQAASHERVTHGSFRNSFRHFALLLTCGALPAYLGFQFFAEPVIAFALGSKWFRSGTFIEILAPYFAVRFVATALACSMMIGKKQHWQLLTQIGLFAETAIVYVVSRCFQLHIETFLRAISWSYAANYAVLLILTFWVSHQQVPIAGSGPEVAPAVAAGTRGVR